VKTIVSRRLLISSVSSPWPRNVYPFLWAQVPQQSDTTRIEEPSFGCRESYPMEKKIFSCADSGAVSANTSPQSPFLLATRRFLDDS
jgi:hypothetical protein